MRTERPVALELGFTEPLIGRRLVRELLAAARVAIDVVRYPAAALLGNMAPQGGFDVDELAVGDIAVNGAVTDVRNGAVQARPARLVRALGLVGKDFDL